MCRWFADSLPQGTPILGPLGLGPFFATLANPSGLEFGVPGGSVPATISGGLLDYNNNVADAVYHGLTVTALEKMGRYLNLTANYTYSHTIDNGNFTTFINLPENQFDYQDERANSNQDARHRLVTNFTASTPDHGFARNFEFSSIITLQSGRPFTLFAGNDTFGDVAGGSTDRVGGAPVDGTCTSGDELHDHGEEKYLHGRSALRLGCAAVPAFSVDRTCQETTSRSTPSTY